MYDVTVVRKSYVQRKSFPFGEWAEIGFWLDDNGYNMDGYVVTITFRS